MGRKQILDVVHGYFHDKLMKFGTTPAGVDYNSPEAQSVRFAQLVKVIDRRERFSVIDYGCGFGSLYDYLRQNGFDCDYYGIDMIVEMVGKGLELHAGDERFHCTTRESDLPLADYLIGGAIFNNRLTASHDEWTDHVLDTLRTIDRLCCKGFSFNMLTSYSDKERQRPDLYYGDPLFFFDFCKRNFSKNVALFHDYGLYDFTILVRKEV